MAGRGDPRRHHAQAVAVRRHRRHRRRHDHQHPRIAHSGRNWDYRYCWLRDAFFVVRALNSLSEVGTMEDYLRWLSNVVVEGGDGHIQPLYGIGLEKTCPSVVPSWPATAAWARCAWATRRPSISSTTCTATSCWARRRPSTTTACCTARAWPNSAAGTVGDNAVRVYGQPDAGMWELRTRARVHTSSALMSWAACDRLAKIAATLQLAERASHWQQRADRMRAEILDQSWSEERQAFAESFGGQSWTPACC
jgi:GH15 family glucan-1,4-alpha-glucosidase